MLTMSQHPAIWSGQTQQQGQMHTHYMPFELLPYDLMLTQADREDTTWDEPEGHEEYALPFDQTPDTFTAVENTAGPQATALRSNQPMPTAEDWETHRDTIIRLYIDEDRTLKDVMQLMQTQHHFKATQKMYKSRLTAWNVRKYMTWAERETACRVMKLKQRTGEGCGKVIVRGRERRLDVFLRHAGHSRAGSRRRQLLHRGNPLEDILIDAIEPQPLSLIIQPTMYPAHAERAVEVVCKELPYLVCAMSDQYFSYDLLRIMDVACDMSSLMRPTDVRISLNWAAIWYYEAIAAQPATALFALLQSQARIDFRGIYHPDLFSSFYRHLLHLTRQYYGPQHSLTSLVRYILQLSEINITEVTHQNVLTSILTHDQAREKSNVTNWRMQLATSLNESGQYQKAKLLLIDVMGSVAERSSYDTYEEIIDAMGSVAERSSYDTHEEIMCGYYLAAHYIIYERQMYEEAESILSGILEAGKDAVIGEVDSFYAYYVNLGFGILAEERGQAEAAITSYRLRIQAALDVWGEDDAVTVTCVADLARYLREIDREEQAMEAEKLIRLTDEFSELDLE